MYVFGFSTTGKHERNNMGRRPPHRAWSFPTALALQVAICTVPCTPLLASSVSLASSAGATWTACTQDGGGCMAATVPGTALTTLIANGTFPTLPPGSDPYLDEYVLGPA